MTTFTRKDFATDQLEISKVSKGNLQAANLLSEDAYFEVAHHLRTDMPQHVIDQLELGYIADWMVRQTVNNLSAVPRPQKDIAEIARAAIHISRARQRYLANLA